MSGISRLFTVGIRALRQKAATGDHIACRGVEGRGDLRFCTVGFRLESS